MKRLLIASIIAVYGCSSLSQLVVDVKAYFNTFYNLKTEFERAEKLYHLGQIAQARPYYMKVEEKGSRILQLHSNSSFVDETIFMMAVAYSRLKSYTKAEKKFKEFFAYFPSSPLKWKAYLEYGIMLYQMKRYEEAQNYLQRALQAESPSIRHRAKLYLAKILIERGDYEQAADLLEELLEAGYGGRDLYLTASEVYLKLGNVRRAKELILEYVSDPRLSDSLKNSALKLLALAYVKEGNYDEAYRALEQMVVRDSTPEYYAVKLDMGRLLLMKGDTTGAEEIFQFISETSKDTTRFYGYYYMGIIKESQGEYEQALSYYEDASKMGLEMAKRRKETLMKVQSVQEETDPVKVYRVAEILYLDMGDVDMAVQLVKKVLEMNPPEWLEKKALLFLTYVYAKDLEHPDSASLYLQKLRQKYPNSLYVELGQQYLR